MVDGITFASVKEGHRYRQLTLLRAAGMISDLRLQPKVEITVNTVHVANYIADFAYTDLVTGQTVYEDVKSEITRRNPTYRLKVKLVKAVHGISVVEV